MNIQRGSALLAALIGVVYASTAAAAQSAACDRPCLNALADNYIAAMVAHDPSRVQLAPDARIVENVKRIRPGEGLWKTASAPPGEFRIHVPDVTAQQVGFLGVMQAEGKPVMLALRLKLENGRISEAEHLVLGNIREAALEGHLKAPRKVFSMPVPMDYRDNRASLVRIGLTYYDALDNNNGSLAPFADDCVRFENGVQTSRNAVPSEGVASDRYYGAMNCGPQLDTNAFEYITRIDNRRVLVADEETGLAFGLSHFRHEFSKKEFPVFNIPGVKSRTLDYNPFDMPALHIFKIWGGRMHEIEALGISAPYNAPTGWEP